MKRWSVALLLMLLPFTMAPRTSLTEGPSDLELHQIISRTTAMPGSAVTYLVQARNTTDAPIEEAVVEIVVTWDGKADLNLTTSRDCTTDTAGTTTVVTCRLGTVQPDELRTVRVSARPAGPGLLIFDASGLSVLGPIEADKPVEVEFRDRAR